MSDDTRKTTDHGERPDMGHTPDQLAETLDQALTGSNGGSDTRAGSLRGGSASGSDIDPDQQAIDRVLTSEGMAAAETGDDGDQDGASAIRNTGRKGGPGDDADAATG
ncbi:MAG: ribonuclease [Brevundimonas sp.]|uniref:ribonuclease n=1 Tax=Brevundimonas sp. TaxID=1871086 RepID=UPI00391C1B3E